MGLLSVQTLLEADLKNSALSLAYVSRKRSQAGMLHAIGRPSDWPKSDSFPLTSGCDDGLGRVNVECLAYTSGAVANMLIG